MDTTAPVPTISGMVIMNGLRLLYSYLCRVKRRVAVHVKHLAIAEPQPAPYRPGMGNWVEPVVIAKIAALLTLDRVISVAMWPMAAPAGATR